MQRKERAADWCDRVSVSLKNQGQDDTEQNKRCNDDSENP